MKRHDLHITGKLWSVTVIATPPAKKIKVEIRKPQRRPQTSITGHAAIAPKKPAARYDEVKLALVSFLALSDMVVIPK